MYILNTVEGNSSRDGRSGKTCRKKCPPRDSQCFLNTTQSISYQGLSIPSIPIVQEPIVISRLHLSPSRGSSINFRDSYSIIDGNFDGYFGLIKNNGEGVLKLLKPIKGPLDISLKIIMEAKFQENLRNFRVQDQLSKHLVNLDVIVAPYTF